ncbi:ImmA/IrrE family metallo-endopeptidase [Stenotrophomonas maltophilia]|jgi:hypothetical protein|uniref:ImmA/IrrE family metallo-endopeptidase n=1 Tax=Stenotrophomonas maltophilia TaxID=40324 RepID=UPI001311DC7F|nr:ImmA/IrrE family metallo-endopeptidase [Stenotrophomonas maltophilia]MBA0332752.1 ImmA/IrrE family metallo-endopeptidase [Stenotrophomonas maltophilia]MEA1829475.1 ImmA/IrrE family metallo-endopeptidase [Stenotrophomonas maltophilia]
MSGYCFQVPPLSTDKITAKADVFRKALGVETDRFPLIEVVEYAIPLLWEAFSLQVREKSEMGSAHGLTFPETAEIWLREDVYEGFLANQPRDRFTVAHEVGHLLLHNGVGLARSMRKPSELKAYENSEWQANTFAGALLIPTATAQRLRNELELADACNVSVDAAKVRLASLRQRGMLK